MAEQTTAVVPADGPTIDGFDPLSQTFLRDPYVFFERARREAPVFFHPGPPMPFWVLSKYAGVAAMLGDPATVSIKVLGLSLIPNDYRNTLPPDYFAKIVK